MKRKNKAGKELQFGVHSFKNAVERAKFRRSMLDWYDKNKRDLPWRKVAERESDANRRAYSVWVSEIMLQQTQVATVIEYYNRWMKVVNELDGQVPRSAQELQQKLPGVGKYTAGAIASIAFGESTSLVDGNVARVFSRLQTIGADITSQEVTDTLWSLADAAVDPDRPGDFNQSLMELGATICTPKNVKCGSCPVSHLCKAYAKVQHEKQRSASILTTKTSSNGHLLPDIECLVEDCSLCLPPEDQWDSSLGVMNYPRKGKKKAPREEKTAVCVVCRFKEASNEKEYLIVQRQETGLLAGLWEFPSVTVEPAAGQETCQTAMQAHLQQQFGTVSDSMDIKFVNEVVHIFSHIHQTYVVETLTLTNDSALNPIESSQPVRWVTKDEFLNAAISTAMKKVFKAFEGRNISDKHYKKNQSTKDGKKQTALDAFFKTKLKKS